MRYLSRTMNIYSMIVILSACTLLEHEDMLSYNGSTMVLTSQHLSYRKRPINRSRSPRHDLTFCLTIHSVLIGQIKCNRPHPRPSRQHVHVFVGKAAIGVLVRERERERETA